MSCDGCGKPFKEAEGDLVKGFKSGDFAVEVWDAKTETLRYYHERCEPTKNWRKCPR